MKAIRLLLAILVVFSLTACSTYRMYSGPARKKHDVAIIKHGEGVWAETIDGEKVPGQGEYEVLPGHHSMMVYYYVGAGVGRSTAYCARSEGSLAVDLWAESGHTYRIDPEFFDAKTRWSPVVKDVTP